MFKWAKKLKSDFNEARDQTRIDRRNAERRELCAEYARQAHNPARRGEIIHRLARLSGEANIDGAIARIGYELQGIDRRVQADTIRLMPEQAHTVSHFAEDLRHFRADYCGTRAAFDAESA